MFSLRTKSIFNYDEDAFYVDGIYCFNHYCEELMRIYNGLRSTMSPNYKALSTPRREREVQVESSTGTVQVMRTEAEQNELISTVLSALPEANENTMVRDILPPDNENEKKMEEVMEPIEKLDSKQMHKKNLEEKVKDAVLKVGITNSYEVARYIHEPRGTTWHAIQRLGLTDRMKRGRRKKRSYYQQ